MLLAEDRGSMEDGIVVVPLSWKSWLLKRVALITLDAETQAAVEAVNAAIFARKFIGWFVGVKEDAVPIDLRTDCDS